MSAHTENLQFSREDVEFEIPDDLPEKLGEELRRLEQLFTVDTATLKKITDRFGEELEDGLQKHGSNVPMNITWVTAFPTGRETGTYLTLDLGGTNLRVCLITLTGTSGGADITQEKYQLPKAIKTGTADELFGHIADRLDDFVKAHVDTGNFDEDDGKVPLGFTFSYPATQGRIDHGILQTWTKGWDVQGVEGHDVAEMLKEAIAKRDLPVKLVALINDTTGALIASAYNDPETIIGAIFGTGCNAAYMERALRIPKLRQKDPSSNGTTTTSRTENDNDGADDSLMAINCEYGAFDNSHTILPRTRYDELIDEQSPRPGEQTFEKMSAGLYLGEIFRQVLLELHSRRVIFQNPNLDDKPAERLATPYAIDTEFLSNLENDSSESLTASACAFQETLSNLHPSPQELRFFQALAKLIAIRGARLCACGVSAICRRIGVRRGHVAADGSVAIKHPRFRERWEDAVREILDMKMGAKAVSTEEAGSELEGIELTSAEDGSGVGAAVITALALGRVGKLE
ncbi:hypothetical protein AYO21_02949 [Fonsecaea monophora]|uniref:Phosphotransferase n=1 Tax=Fonsecaea monophora TaxID=254056 RepID=A0A177FFX7_9EURO|nr:hypothetical protein AYO21_02949 [Fonsecaea monophora]OAG42666.1 hypothetical protein AYO21_02949 [Fonsecaea monophora]